MNDTMNQEKVSAAEFYAEIYSGFTELTAQDLADYKVEIDREKNEEIVWHFGEIRIPSGE